MKSYWKSLIKLLSGAPVQAVLLLFVRIVLAGIFWRSGRIKIAEDSWFTISDTTYVLFAEDYSGVPLPADIGAVMATIGEHLFPALLVIGLLTRLSALALLGMTMVIQIFVYPEAWWSVHSLWVALALVLITQGPGALSLDRAFAGRKAAA